jgi:hypothetical protein
LASGTGKPTLAGKPAIVGKKEIGMNTLSRRRFLEVSALGAGGLLLGRGLAQNTSLAGGMAQAANQFLNALGANRSKASFGFDDAERLRWHWTTPQGFPRNGVALRDMTPSQRTAALALLRSGVSEAGYKKSLEIMGLQAELGQDPEHFFVSVFGTPGGREPWGWRIEGHHLSRQYAIVGERVSTTPFFHGAWPTQTRAGLRVMGREEDAARELVRSLDSRRQGIAVFQRESLFRHETWNQTKVSPLEPVGLLSSELNSAQEKLVVELIQSYLSSLPAAVSAPMFERITKAGLDKVRFGWAGSLEARRPYYWRLQGPSFLLEHDNSRNGATHIHSVWRDFEGDFGANL